MSDGMKPAGYRMRFRSEPGMIGHYPWSYHEWKAGRIERPHCEYEDLVSAAPLRDLADKASDMTLFVASIVSEVGLCPSECWLTLAKKDGTERRISLRDCASDLADAIVAVRGK